MIEDDNITEPKDYFAELKTKINKMEYKKLEDNMAFLGKEIQKAERLGQKNLSHKSAYMWQILEKEMILNSLGYEDFVYRQDVVRLIDSITPKNSVKIIELENFPRVIPDMNVEDIEKARNLEIFDLLVVIYTDFTDEEVNTPEQKSFVARNRDPIVFGMFLNEKINLKHDRMYFITDWEDEFCDLTFTKMLDRMREIGIEKPGKKISVDIDNINRIVSESLIEVETIKNISYTDLAKNKKVTFMSKVKSWFSSDA